MTDTETRDLLMRMYAIWPSAMPPESRRKMVREEWQHLLAGSSAKLLNEALDRYAGSPTGKYMPKPGELLQICDNILEERRRKNALSPGRCPLCGDSKYVLVDAAEPFYGNYGSLGIVCPCRKFGEMQALEQGLKITREVKPGHLEIWLDRGRILGRLKVFEKKEPPAASLAKAEPPRQQSIKLAFDDLPF